MSLTPYSPPNPEHLALREDGPGRPEFMVDPLLDRHDLSYVFKTNWKLLVLLPILCALLAFGWKAFSTPYYESSTMLLVDSSLDQLLQFEKVASNGITGKESLRSMEVAIVADSVVLRVVAVVGDRVVYIGVMRLQY